jgi:hypothetical protein
MFPETVTNTLHAAASGEDPDSLCAITLGFYHADRSAPTLVPCSLRACLEADDHIRAVLRGSGSTMAKAQACGEVRRGRTAEAEMAELAVSVPTDIDRCREHLDEDGYVVMRGIVSPDRLGQLNAALADEFQCARSKGQLFNGGGMLTGHLNCFPGDQSRFVYDQLEAAGVVDLVKALRPDLVERLRATMNFNLPGSVAQHYHSDGLYTEEFLICNVAVVDTTVVNGALDVLPGTHNRFYKFWRYALERKYRLSTRVLMQRGDAVLRKSTLWHRGTPNRTDVPRPMMAITFGEIAAPEADPFDLNGGQAFFFPNWYSTSPLGQLRERVYVRAPITYSAYRFARSLYGNKGYSSW